MRLTIRLIAVFALILPYCSVFAQDLGAFLRSNNLPQKIKPSELGDDMRAVKITTDKGGDPFSSLMMAPLMLMGSIFSAMGTQSPQGEDPSPQNNQNALAMRFFEMIGISWTNGTTVKLYDQEFLVTYAVQFDMASLMQSKAPPDVSKMDLTLTLVNTKSIATLSPRPDMTKAEWNKSMGPEISQATDSAKRSATLSNVKQLSVGALIYCADYDDVFPYVQSSRGAFEVLQPYLKNREIVKSLNPVGGEFRLNMAVAGVNQTAIDNPAEMILFYEPQPWPDGKRAVSFTDGHAKFVTPEEWARLEPLLRAKLPKSGKPLPATLGANWPGG